MRIPPSSAIAKMAAFPPQAQIVGKHGGIYEAYYMQADPKGTGSIGALDAANFLKKSKLSDIVLSQVWDMSDPMGKGYLEKSGFFVALKLIALVQNQQDMNTSKLGVDTPPPDLGPVEPVEPNQNVHNVNIPWDITLSEKSNYDKVFDSLQPVNNMLGGDKVKPVLMNSKLPVDVLGRIWDMSDIDKDGYLDRDEFAVAMHLVYQAREGNEIPSFLRPGLVPPSKRTGGGLGGVPPLSTPLAGLPGAVPGLGRSTPTQGLSQGLPQGLPQGLGKVNSAQVPWVVTPSEKANSDAMFATVDTDHDGLVTGAEIRGIMVQSGLPNAVLAHIWGLCDSQSLGKLNAEQFALALYLIAQKVKGVEVPAQLSPEMVPPSMRLGPDPGAFGVRELDQLAKEVEDIKKERLQLERDKSQMDADLKIRQSEVTVLQKELDSLNGTLAQLDSQKREAQKRLDELNDKRSNLERNVQELRDNTNTEQMEVNKMKSLLGNREQMIKDKEKELEKLRKELTDLREEESKLEQTLDSSKQQLDQFAKSKKDIDTEISTTRQRVQHLQEQSKALGSTQNFANFNGDAFNNVDVASTKATVGSPVSTVSSFSVGSNVDDFKEDPFKNKDPFGGANSIASSQADPFGGANSIAISQADPFQNDDPFRDSDPFKSSDPFGADDPFKDAFGTSGASDKADPFGGADPFGNSGGTGVKAGDGFDAFGASWGTSDPAKSSQISNNFGADPFGESSKPSLPNKQKKAPPPRPAPPKSKSPLPFATPSSSTKPKVDPFPGFGSDPFGGADPFSSSNNTMASANTASDPFANFADFSPGKFEDNSSAWGQ
ncbi:epidermal growth factor receptor substrate 15-like 1 [Elysia marginata]|uniref:Epidermal growth factor receptor substrate 15-like 1 n=1 Tax=Elysia marginata TaxID=1093978 RepID=A0AAV4HL46_9GAST|nr:epidermal growth factor receptor substrate 15-like 1 [Elysia marginata]